MNPGDLRHCRRRLWCDRSSGDARLPGRRFRKRARGRYRLWLCGDRYQSGREAAFKE